jgi:hypothetical protein
LYLDPGSLELGRRNEQKNRIVPEITNCKGSLLIDGLDPIETARRKKKPEVGFGV